MANYYFYGNKVTERIIGSITSELEYPYTGGSSTQVFVSEEIVDGKKVKLTATFEFEISDTIKDLEAIKEKVQNHINSYNRMCARKVMAHAINNLVGWRLEHSSDSCRADAIADLNILLNSNIPESKILSDIELFTSELKEIQSSRELSVWEKLFGLDSMKEYNLPLYEHDQAVANLSQKENTDTIPEFFRSVYFGAVGGVVRIQQNPEKILHTHTNIFMAYK